MQELYSNDGLAPGIFKFLWLWKGTGSDNQSVHIPQTVRVCAQQMPAAH
jgi:hypothetical protein